MTSSQNNERVQPNRTITLNWLISKGLPPLPVAPPQDPYKYPKTNKNGEIEYSKEKGVPKSLYTGKNPSYLDASGKPHLVNHRQFQKRLPTQKELKLWFANPLNGIGTLGGWFNINWLDFDVKQFESPAKCEAAAVACIAKIRELTNQMPFIERTHSGGWRVGVRVKQKPNFTNFALTPGGTHVGEALGEGRFTVLAPTKGETNNLYENISREFPPEIESLDLIGIYSTSTTLDKERVRQSSQSSPSLPLPLPTPANPTTPTTSDIPPIPATPGTIPLEELAFEPAKQVLRGDDIKGDRSESLTGAVKELIGWENWNYRNNIHFVGSADELAYPAAERLGIDSERCDRILRSIKERHTLTPACYKHGGDESCWKKIWKIDRPSFEAYCPEVLRERIKAEFRKNAKNTSASSGSSSSSSSSSSSTGEKAADNVVQFPTAPMEFGELRKQMRELMNKNLSSPELKSAQILLRLEYGRISEREFNDLWEKEEKEFEAEVEKEERKSAIDEILTLKNTKVNVEDFFAKKLANPLEVFCRSLTLGEGVAVTTVLSTMSSLHKVGTELVIKIKDRFIVPPTIFSALVAESGQKKSPIFRNLANDPLNRLSLKSKQHYEQQMKEYRKAVAAYNKSDKSGDPPVEPARVVYSFNSATAEGLKNQAARCPDKGMLALIDELAGYFYAQNQYRGGKGADKQELLSYFDTVGSKVLRADGLKVETEKVHLSVFGTIQPEVLADLMKNGDPDGFWARFLFIFQESVANYLKEEDSEVDVSDLLTGIYERIDQLPRMSYHLSKAALKRYIPIYNALEDLRMVASGTMKNIYPKISNYIPRLALNLHVLDHVLTGSEGTLPSQEISLEVMEKAIALGKFYLGQAKMIQMNSSKELDDSSTLGKLVSESQRLEKGITNGWLKAKTFANCFSSKKRPSAEVCRSWFREAESLGYGKCRGSGVRLEFKAFSHDQINFVIPQDVEEQVKLPIKVNTILVTTEVTTSSSTSTSTSIEKSGAVGVLEPQVEPLNHLPDNAWETFEAIYTPPVVIEIEDGDSSGEEETLTQEPLGIEEESPLIPIEKGALCRFVGLIEAAKVLEEYADITELKEEEDYVVDEVQGQYLRLRKASGDFFIEDGEESELSDYYRYEIFRQSGLNADKPYRYIGTKWNLQKICQHKPLYVVKVEGDRVIVTSPEWGASITNEIPVADLREVAVQKE